MSEAQPTAAQQSLLGAGLACEAIQPGLDIGRDLRLSIGADGLDLAPVQGLANLVQCLEIALTTGLCADVFNVGFGFDGVNALVDETLPLLIQERVRIAAIQTLTSDQRVRSILDLKILDGRLDPISSSTDAGSGSAPSLDGSRTLSVSVAFDTIAGDQAAVNIGRLIASG
jgi:hypothetical protein